MYAVPKKLGSTPEPPSLYEVHTSVTLSCVLMFSMAAGVVIFCMDETKQGAEAVLLQKSSQDWPGRESPHPDVASTWGARALSTARATCNVRCCTAEGRMSTWNE